MRGRLFLVNSKKQSKFNFIEKLKGIKHIEIILIVAFCSILLLIYASTFSGNKKQEVTTTTLTTEEYANYLENKLSNVLKNIRGAGDVSVMITLSCGIEYIYATNTEEVTTSSTTSGTTTSKTTTTQDLIMVNVAGKSTPVVLKENLPKVSGVIIVASGAQDISVRLELQKAVEALLDVEENNIEILIGKKGD